MNYKNIDKISQMLLVGVPNRDCIPGVIQLIKKYHIGGVILYRNNYNNIYEMIGLINQLKKANEEYNIPLTIAIDQEGGRVNRLPKDIQNFRPAFELANRGEEVIDESSYCLAKLLAELGINMNFSPVLDIRTQRDDNAFIGDRALSRSVETITKFGEIIVNNHIKNGIIPVIKHYPGHGNINIDSHVFLPIIKNFNRNREDLKPFHYLMKNGVPAIMVGHILIPSLTKIKPASLSKMLISELIRKEQKYEGLVITDEIGMKAIRLFFGKYRSIKLAFFAGNDIVCCKYKPGYIEKCLNIILSNINEIDLDYHFNKIVQYKKKFHFSDKINNVDLDIEKYNKNINHINQK